MESGDSGARDFLQGGGRVGALMRAHDWGASVLGVPENWPQSLKTVVNVLLTSRFQMWMAWGDELTFFYNDAYSPTLGIKVDFALGASAREVWKEIWPDIGPRIESVLDTGEATWDEGLLLFLERSGFPEETYHTFSYSPLSDDDGKRVGMLCVVTEETERIIGQRQVTTLRDLASTISGKNTRAELCQAIVQSLGENLQDLPFTLTYLFAPDGSAELVCSSGIPEDSALAPETIAPGSVDPVWPLEAARRTRSVLVVENIGRRFDHIPFGAWNVAPRDAVLAPIARQGEDAPAGFLIVGLNPYRANTDSYRGFIGLVAGQIASGLANADAYEEERRRAEALAEIDRAKTAFFSNTSHEFRTPLTLMLSPLEDMLAQQPIDGVVAAERSQIELMRRNGVRLLKLVNTLLDFSRIEAGRVQSVFEPVDLAAYSAELASTFRSAMEKAGIDFVVACPPLSRPVHVDRDMWEKIVLNLVSNAFKYTLEGSVTVALKPDEDGGSVTLEVRDTGVGIPAEDLPRLFERFHRVADQRGRTQEGTGIGLALVQELVRLHKGTVKIESAVGRGTCVRVTLPMDAAQLPAGQSRTEQSRTEQSRSTARVSADAFVDEALRWLPDAEPRDTPQVSQTAFEAAPTPSTRRPTVLLVDDNADMRDYVRRLLADRYTVEIAHDGEEALARARQRTPDLVLSDIMMPKLDGFGLLRALRDDAALREVPVILLSARAGEEASVEGLEAGADDYLVKPFSARELLARVRANLDMAKLRREAVRIEYELRMQAEAEVAARTAELSAKEAQLRTIFETSYSFQVLVALDGTLLDANATALEGIDAPIGEVLGRPFWDTAWFSATPGIPELVRNAIPTVGRGHVVRRELRLNLPVGGWRWFDFQIRPMQNAQGDIIAIVAEAVELTARRQAEEALRHSQKMEAIGQLTGGVAHDFNNLLTIIRSSADLLRLRNLPDERRKRYIDAISDTADRAAKLTSQLLAFSRRQSLTPQVFDAAAQIEDIAEMIKTVVGSRIAFELSVEERPLMVEADRSQFETALINLAANARDAIEGDGTLRIRIARARTQPPAIVEQRAGSFVSIAISDSGCGIAPEHLEKIFEPFFTTKEVGRGTGLGLSQVYGFARQSGGIVTVDSEPGKGTTFTVHLPLSTLEDEANAPVQVSASALPAARGHILLVEDNAEVGEFSSHLLRELGFEVALATNADEALEILDKNAGRIDLVFSDVVMPGTDGVSLGHEIRRRNPQMPVVLTSGYSHVLAEEGSHGFELLRKPYSVEELSGILRRALARRDPGAAAIENNARGHAEV